MTEIPQTIVRDLLKKAGYNPNLAHPECYKNFSWITFSELLLATDRILSDKSIPKNEQRITPRICMTELDWRERARDNGYLGQF